MLVVSGASLRFAGGWVTVSSEDKLFSVIKKFRIYGKTNTLRFGWQKRGKDVDGGVGEWKRWWTPVVDTERLH